MNDHLVLTITLPIHKWHDITFALCDAAHEADKNQPLRAARLDKLRNELHAQIDQRLMPTSRN